MFAVATLLALTAGSAMAIVPPGTLDASQTSYDTNLLAPVQQQAQTFVPTISGSLGTVLVHTNVYVPAPTVVVRPNVTNVTVEITSTSGGLPTGTVLATQTVTPQSGGWTVVTFSAPTNVTAGTKYALELAQLGGDTTMWDFDCAQPYGPGNAVVFSTTWKSIFAYDTQDCLASYAFQTYIVVPAATAPPVSAPPTSTMNSAPGDAPGNPGYMLILAGLAVAAAATIFVSSRRRVTQR
jgi:hypothetical protein